jgi:hypothetical protein
VTLEHFNHLGLLGAGAWRGLLGRCSFAPLGCRRLTLGRAGYAAGFGCRGSGIGRRRALWGVGLDLDAGSLEAGAGNPERRRVVAARGALVLDQALGLEAPEHLVDGAALAPERLGQRQDGTVGALRGGAEDHGLGVAELDHG